MVVTIAIKLARFSLENPEEEREICLVTLAKHQQHIINLDRYSVFSHLQRGCFGLFEIVFSPRMLRFIVIIPPNLYLFLNLLLPKNTGW